MAIEVERQSADGLSSQFWRFNLWTNGGGTEVTLSLSDYQQRSRATTRHKMKVDHRWSRMDQRSYYSDIKAADVALPNDVIQEAQSKVTFAFEGPSP